ncbi:MAG: hypothetical protein DRJ01_15405 [Bacteroidetes bacterium]|nr:MAG: hypothetical protein DRJ01_15405 [Bacteroidota bacterium]
MLCVRVFDLDGDGDIDILSSSYYDNKIAWYENTDGQGTFVPQQIIDSPTQSSNVMAYGLDGDGDNDILFDSAEGGLI